MKKIVLSLVLVMLFAGCGWAYQDAAQLKELQQKAEAGNPQAQAALGDYYANVYEDAKRSADYPKALMWYEKAAAQGEAYSQVALAHLYYYGDSVPKDLTKAFKWAEISAKAGINDTQILLADMYKNGEGVAQNLQEAYMWFYVALEYAYDELRPQVVKEMADLEKALSKEQVAAAKKPPNSISRTCGINLQMFEILAKSDTINFASAMFNFKSFHPAYSTGLAGNYNPNLGEIHGTKTFVPQFTK